MKNVTYINAGAGSGKTYKLTEILSEELKKQEGVKPSEVILTTFTEMAAAEFREKSRQRLYDDGHPDIANQLDAATIGTVHSVAFSFIKKYWYLAGITPDAKVMSEDDMQIYISQSLGDYVTDTDLEFFREYCDYFNIDDPLFWQDELLNVIEKINHYDVDLNGCIEKSKETISLVFNEKGNLNTELLKEFQSILKNQKGTYKDEKIKKKADELLAENPNYSTLLKLYNEISIGKFLGSADRLKPFCVGMGNRLDLFVNNLKSTLLSSLSTTEWKSPGEMMKTMVNTIFRIASNWNKGFKDFKDSRHIIDYNDMEEKFLKLLDSEEVRKEISADYKLMMVDEFQDSSPIQLSIFKKLSDLMKQSYWVGDPKQSIYGFRGADVSLVNDLIKVFDDKKERELNGLSLPDPLPNSYRSRKELVELVNNCFMKAFNGIIEQGRVRLTPNRQDESGLSEPLAHWNCYGNLTQNKSFIEKTADRVKLLLESDLMVKPKDKPIRKIEPGDIAILCLKNSDCKNYAKALTRRGIPVSYVNDEISQQIEVHLVISLLQLTVDDSNKHIRADLLRLLKDQKTAEILNCRLNYLYLQNKEIEAKEVTEQESSEEKKLSDNWLDDEPLIQQLKAFVKASHHFSVSDLVENIIYGLSLPEVVAKWGEKEERQQNLSTICALAKQYDSHCQQMGIGASVGGFISYLSYAKLDAKIDNSANSVKVLTYHKSKGLEWNYVIMELPKEDKLKDNTFALWNYWGVREMRMEDNENYVIQYLPRILSSMNSTKIQLPQLFVDNVIKLNTYKTIKERETNQLRHLLYVGMTRARDYLTTLGRCSSSKNNKDIPTAFWLKNAGVSEGIMNKTLAELWGVEGLEGNIEDITNVQEADQTKASKYNYYEHPELMLSVREPKYLSPSKLPEIEVAQENIKIQADLICRIEPYRTNTENQAAAGTCIHNIFAVYNPALYHEENVEKATSIRNGNLMYEIIPDTEKVIISIEKLYAWLKETYGEAAAVKHEVPFIQSLPGQVVHGEIDLLWYLNDHECVLIDFKNFPGDKKSIMTQGNDHYAGNYAPQLKAYKDVLQSSGIKVKDTLIYYSVMGCVVSLNL